MTSHYAYVAHMIRWYHCQCPIVTSDTDIIPYHMTHVMNRPVLQYFSRCCDATTTFTIYGHSP